MNEWRVNRNRSIEYRFTCARCGGQEWWPQFEERGREHPELCTECWRDDFWGRRKRDDLRAPDVTEAFEHGELHPTTTEG
jgi:hypothetical protein